MRLLAVAILALTAAVAFTGAVLLTRDQGKKTVTVTAAAPQPSVSDDARTMAAIKNIDPVTAQERIRTANVTCDVLRDVGEKALWSICTINIENGDPWYDTMPPRQLRAMSDALIRANQ